MISFADGVGQRAFQSPSGGDKEFVIVDKDEKDCAIVLAFLALLFHESAVSMEYWAISASLWEAG